MADSTAASYRTGRSSLANEDKTLLGYEKGQNQDDGESDWEENGLMLTSRTVAPRPLTTRDWFCLVLLMTVVSSLAATVGYMFNKTCTEQQCVRMTSSYCEYTRRTLGISAVWRPHTNLAIPAPLLKLVEYHDYQFEAELGVENAYKGHPRPELDAAWERIGASR